MIEIPTSFARYKLPSSSPQKKGEELEWVQKQAKIVADQAAEYGLPQDLLSLIRAIGETRYYDSQNNKMVEQAIDSKKAQQALEVLRGMFQENTPQEEVVKYVSNYFSYGQTDRVFAGEMIEDFASIPVWKEKLMPLLQKRMESLFHENKGEEGEYLSYILQQIVNYLEAENKKMGKYNSFDSLHYNSLQSGFSGLFEQLTRSQSDLESMSFSEKLSNNKSSTDKDFFTSLLTTLKTVHIHVLDKDDYRLSKAR